MHAELEAELQRAAEIQAQLLPQAAPDVPGYAFAGLCLPSRHAGGDFFDWQAEDGVVRIVLGDVMGKGMAAALLMATARAALRAVAHLPVADAVAAVNRALFPDLAPTDSFVTLFYAHLEAGTGVLHYVDAGHGMAVIRRRDGGAAVLGQGSLPLGILSDTVYQEHWETLVPGDTLVLYSDGLPDARPALALDPEGVAAQLDGEGSAQEQLAHLVALAGPSLPDDLTLVLVRRLDPPGEGTSP